MKRIIMCILFICYGNYMFSQLKFKKYEQCGDFQEITMEIISDTTLMIITELNCTHCVDYPTHVEIFCTYRLEGDSLYIGKINPPPRHPEVMFLCKPTVEYASASGPLKQYMQRQHQISCILPNLENLGFYILTIDEKQFIDSHMKYLFTGVNDE